MLYRKRLQYRLLARTIVKLARGWLTTSRRRGPHRKWSRMAATTITLRDVARHAGVHPATASRALNDATRSLVNEATARRVLQVAEDLGYRPNPIARGLKTNRSTT